MEHAVELPTRFRSESAPTDGLITITDNETGRATTVGLTYYGIIAKTLNELFEADKTEVPIAVEAEVAESSASAAETEPSSEPAAKPEAPAEASIATTPQEAAPEPKKSASRKKTSARKNSGRQTDNTENVVAVAVATEEKPATKEKPAKKTAPKNDTTTANGPARKTGAKPAAKRSTPKPSSTAKPTADIIEGKGFKLMPRADTEILTYDIVADSGGNLGTVWQHQDTGRFHVTPTNSEKFGPTDHTSLPAAKARVFVISR